MVGADPSFTQAHIVRTLFILDESMMGRKKLVKVLGLGEGSVRTIIKRLTKDGLIDSSKKGHFLTTEGKRWINSIQDRFTRPYSVESDLVEGFKSLIVVHNAVGRLGSIVSYRDVAVKAGALGALILKNDGGKLVFPSAEDDLKGFEGEIDTGRLKLTGDDVIVIVFANTYEIAESGAVSIALDLCGF